MVRIIIKMKRKKRISFPDNDTSLFLVEDSDSIFIVEVLNALILEERLVIPRCLKPYWEKISSIHNSLEYSQALSDIGQWRYDTEDFSDLDELEDDEIQHYDEDDPDLCITSIDRTGHTRTLVICIEMYLRRQFNVYSKYIRRLERPIRGDRRPFILPLPQLCILTNNPDDVRKLEIVIDRNVDLSSKFPIFIPGTRKRISLNKWHTYEDDLLPEFRCRPALFNPMDCMTLLFESTQHISNKFIAKILYHLRPFRFVLPLTFLFDIFGGRQTADIIEKNFPPQKCREFADNLLLMDEQERTFADHCLTGMYNEHLDAEIKYGHRAKSFLCGDFMAYILGLTSNCLYIDIFIEYDGRIYNWLTGLKDCDRPRNDQRLWIEKPRNYPFEAWYRSEDYIRLFRNCGRMWVQTPKMFELNESHPIVQHWMLKYGRWRLPRIIMYSSSLELGNYSVLKLLLGFDLPIHRNAVVFTHTFGFHLREYVLNDFYGCKSEAMRAFINNWRKDELRKIDSILTKVESLESFISPGIRGKMFVKDREKTLNDEKELNRYLNFRRRISLISFPFDHRPIPCIPFIKDCFGLTRSVESIREHLCQTHSTDFFGEKTLPMHVYPLKYLAYWALMTLKDSKNVYNCLCNFDFLSKASPNSDILSRYKKDIDGGDEPKPSTSTSAQ